MEEKSASDYIDMNLFFLGAHGRFTPCAQGKIQREARVQILEPNRWMTEVESQGHGTKLAKPQSQLEQ